MANNLNVHGDGLRLAAGNSETIAASLNGPDAGPLNASHPSAAGVAAVNAALSRLRGRHTQRVTGQADDLRTGSTYYDGADSDGADAVRTVTV